MTQKRFYSNSRNYLFFKPQSIGGRIAALDIIPADNEKIRESANGIPKGVYPCIGIVHPLNGSFQNRKSLYFGDKKKLHIKTKSFNGLKRKNRLSRPQSEGFKTTLGVADSRNDQQLNNNVSHSPDHFTIQRLVHFHLFAVNRPATHNHIRSFFKSRFELLKFRKRGGVVRVHVQNNLSPGRQSSRFHRRTLAPINRLF